MFPEAKRALYVLLCGLMGALLFLVIERSLALIYVIFLAVNPSWASFGMSLSDLFMLDVLAIILSMFLGGWYGVWLGIHWYEVVYQKKTFPGIAPHLAEIFSISNLQIPIKTKNPETKKEEKSLANFWQIEDIITPASGKTESRTVHIKPTNRETAVEAKAKRTRSVKKVAKIV